jgi:hypothetical protein
MKPNNTKPNWAIVYDDDYSSEVTNSQEYIAFPLFNNVKNLNIKMFLSGSGKKVLRQTNYLRWHESLHTQTIQYDDLIVKLSLLSTTGGLVSDLYDWVVMRDTYGDDFISWLGTVDQLWYRLMWFLKNNYYEVIEKTVTERFAGLRYNSNEPVNVGFDEGETGRTGGTMDYIAGWQTGKGLGRKIPPFSFKYNLKYFRMDDEDLPDGAVSYSSGSFAGYKLLNPAAGSSLVFADHVALHEYVHAVVATNGLALRTSELETGELWWGEGVAELIAGGAYGLATFDESGFSGYDGHRSTDPKEYQSADGLTANPFVFHPEATYFTHYCTLAFLNTKILYYSGKNFADFIAYIIQARHERHEEEIRFGSDPKLIAVLGEGYNSFKIGEARKNARSDLNSYIHPDHLDEALKVFTEYNNLAEFKADFQTVGVGDVFVVSAIQNYIDTGDTGSIAGNLFGGPTITMESTVDNFRSTGYKPNFPSNIQESANELKKYSKLLQNENINALVYICHDLESSKEEELLKLLDNDAFKEVYCIVASNDGTCPVSIGPNTGTGFRTSSKDSRLKLYCAEWDKINDAFLLLPKFISLDSEKKSSVRYNNLKIKQTIKAELR